MTDDEAKRAMDEELRLLEYHGKDEIITSHDAYTQLKLENPDGVKYSTGFPLLDKAIDFVIPGELIVVSGPTKHGKTTFLQTMTHHMANSHIASLWFSYELPKRQFLEKFTELPYFLIPKELTGRSIMWIESRVKEAKIKYGASVVFIDHLHFLVDLARLRHPSIEMGVIVRNLKHIAMSKEVVIFLICHLRKLDLDSEPTENDLRDSSLIAQEADSTLMICRNLKNPKESYLNVRNHRRTGVMGQKIKLRFEEGLLYENDI